MEYPITELLFIACGFFSGSIMFCRIIPMAIMKKDICALSDDGNPGAANVFTSCGPAMGIFCLSLDILKGFVPVLLTMRRFGPQSLMLALMMLAPVLGHATAPLNHFHGGKCIASSFGVTLALIPFSYIVFLLAALYIFFSVVIKIASHRLRSIAAFGFFGILSLMLLACSGKIPAALGCLLISAVSILRHLRSLPRDTITQAEKD